MKTWIIVVKALAAMAVIVGLITDFIGRYYGPDYLTTEKPGPPEWVGWLGWGAAAIGTIVYIALDFYSHKE
jgi:hypothetical protein